jgi:hypothetical protein
LASAQSRKAATAERGNVSLHDNWGQTCNMLVSTRGEGFPLAMLESRVKEKRGRERPR